MSITYCKSLGYSIPPTWLAAPTVSGFGFPAWNRGTSEVPLDDVVKRYELVPKRLRGWSSNREPMNNAYSTKRSRVEDAIAREQARRAQLASPDYENRLRHYISTAYSYSRLRGWPRDQALRQAAESASDDYWFRYDWDVIHLHLTPEEWPVSGLFPPTLEVSSRLVDAAEK